jgi:hypothetical protein
MRGRIAAFRLDPRFAAAGRSPAGNEIEIRPGIGQVSDLFVLWPRTESNPRRSQGPGEAEVFARGQGMGI